MNELNDQELIRREKLNEIRKTCNPYPERYEMNRSLKELSNLDDETFLSAMKQGMLPVSGLFIPIDETSELKKFMQKSIISFFFNGFAV